MADKIQVRRDTAANWTTNNPVLAAGEPGFESDTGKLKIGNGTSNYSTLTSIGGASSGAMNYNFGLLQMRMLGTSSPYALMYNGFADAFNTNTGVATFTNTQYISTYGVSSYGNDAYWSNTTLFHFDGNLNDAGPSGLLTAASFNSTGTPSFVTGKFGQALNLPAGSGYQTKTVPYSGTQFGTGDFTVECFINLSSITGNYQYFFDTRNRSGYNETSGIGFYIAGSKIVAYCGGTYTFNGSTNIVAGTTYHITVERYNGKVYAYIDGVQQGTAWTQTANFSLGDFTIGRACDTTTHSLNGVIDELRITKGQARYKGVNFTVPTSAYQQFATSTLSNTGNFESIAFTSAAAPSSGQAVILYHDKNNVGITPNSDVVLKISRNNGTTWTNAVLAYGGYYDATTQMMIADVDLSSQPQGTNIKYKIEYSNSKMILFKGISLNCI
jgi:hypothetical protein